MVDLEKKIPSWRTLLRSVYVIMCAVFVLTLTNYQALAHSEHGAAPDLEIRAGETDDGDLYFRLTVDHGKDVDGALNGPVHIHSGRPHLIRFINEGELEHEVHFGRDANLDTRLYEENLFGSDEGKHSAHGFLGVHLDPGESTVLHIWIPEGKEGVWEMGCLIPGHYEMGQKAPIHVISDADDDHHDDVDVEEEHHDDGDTEEDKHHNDVDAGHHDEGGSEKHHD